MSRPAVGDLDSVVQQARKLKPLTQEYNAIQEQVSFAHSFSSYFLSQIDCVSSLPSTTQTASLPGWREGLLGKLRVKQSDAYNERERFEVLYRDEMNCQLQYPLVSEYNARSSGWFNLRQGSLTHIDHRL